MKIKFNTYTQQGDEGHTTLYSGEKIDKDSLELETIGTVEELISVVGIVRANASSSRLFYSMMTVQRTLFVIHATLSGVPLEFPIKELEEIQFKVRLLEKNLYESKYPIYPGTTKSNARLFHCRAVTRRLERRLVALNREREVSENILKYVNALDHYFLLYARVCTWAGSRKKDSEWHGLKPYLP